LNVAIAGLGLIGGSFAKAIAARTRHRVTGYDISADVERRALDAGLIDGAGLNTFDGADLTLIALYPGAAAEFMRVNARRFKPGSIVVDMCGVKRYIVKAARGLFGEGVTYIGGHPMAGREYSGFDASRTELFDGASMILTPDETVGPDKLERARNFFLALGFGGVTLTTPDRHDEIIAFTSQMAHIVSSGYAQNPIARNFSGFSAGSFADMTRVAKLDENMWTELFLLNADYLTEQLDILVENLAGFRERIAARDAEGLKSMLRRGREIKEYLMESEK
jgi:prephenate dehydrogenase